MTGARVVLLLVLIAGLLLLAFCWVTVRTRSWSALARRLAALGALGVAALWGYSHRPLPHRDDCALPSRPGELGSICGVRNPEDLELVPELGLVVTAEFERGGRLMALRLADLSAAPVPLWPTSHHPRRPRSAMRPAPLARIHGPSFRTASPSARRRPSAGRFSPW